ncbi:NAD(P)/FAD-dependent oxidoreductase, partial [Streptomyces sp. NPDC051098]
LAGLFKREIVSLGSLEHPRAEFELAAGGKRPGHGHGPDSVRHRPHGGTLPGPEGGSKDEQQSDPRGN